MTHTKKTFISLILLLLAAFHCVAQQRTDTPRRLSGDAYASILTCGPGEEFYEAFGHSALRICDTTNHIDLVFNYGTYDFTTPHFYLKFAKGQLDYCVAFMRFDEFMLEYRYFRRSVWEQRLRLDADELERLFDALIDNVQPQNMYYKYDFFRDNCATRIRDMIDNAVAEGRQFHASEPAKPATYRTMIYKYTEASMPWWRLGVDLLLGARCDQTMNSAEQMYVPLEMMTIYDTTPVAGGAALTETPQQLLPDSRAPQRALPSPTLVFWLLFAAVLLLTLLADRKGWQLTWLDIILFGATGAVALLVMFLWFFSDHWCAKVNLNLIWANPLFLWLAARVRRRDHVVTLCATLLLALFLAGWAWWPQQFNVAVVPMVLTLLTRLVKKLRRQ